MRCVILFLATAVSMCAVPAPAQDKGGKQEQGGAGQAGAKTGGGKQDGSKGGTAKLGANRPLVNRRPGRDEPSDKPASLPGTRAGVVRFDANCRPRRVAPGSAGTMEVLMAFQGNAVMLDPPPVTFAIEPQQGHLTVAGKPTFRPAEQAGLAPALKGLPAYDNYAIFDVPFTVAPDAPAGTQHLAIRISYEVLDGQAGGNLRRFTDRIEMDIEVAPAEAVGEPTAAGTNLAGAGPIVDSARGTATAHNEAVQPEGEPPTAGPMVGYTPEPSMRSEPAPAQPAPKLPTPVREDQTTLIAAGALAVGLILLLILRRARLPLLSR